MCKRHRSVLRTKVREQMSAADAIRREPCNYLIILSHEPLPAADENVQVPSVWWIQVWGFTKVTLLHVKLERWCQLHSDNDENALTPASFNIERLRHGVAQRGVRNIKQLKPMCQLQAALIL